MGTFIQPTKTVGIGFDPFRDRITAINRTGSSTAIGTVGVLALDNEDGDVSDNELDGGNDSGFGNVVAISNTYASSADGSKLQASAIVVVATEVIADNAEGEWVAYGVTDVLVNANTHNIAKGDPLIVDGATAGVMLEVDGATTGENYKVVGIALAAATTDGALISCVVNGVSGLGCWEG